MGPPAQCIDVRPSALHIPMGSRQRLLNRRDLQHAVALGWPTTAGTPLFRIGLLPHGCSSSRPVDDQERTGLIERVSRTATGMRVAWNIPTFGAGLRG